MIICIYQVISNFINGYSRNGTKEKYIIMKLVEMEIIFNDAFYCGEGERHIL
jgi:hypothetical protein